MPSLSGLVRKELRRYSTALSRTLASFDSRGAVESLEDLTFVISEVHALFDDDFLDRLEPSGWIQPLLELSLVPQSAQLMTRLLQTYKEAKSAGILSTSAVSHHQVKRHILAQLVAVEVGQAAFPIQWAAQAIQIEAATQPASQRLGGRLLEQLTAGPTLQAMAEAAHLVRTELWSRPSSPPSSSSSPSAKSSPTSSALETPSSSSPEAEAEPTARRRRGGFSGLRRRLVQVLDDYDCSSSTAGGRLLAVVAHHISAVLAAFEEASPRGAAAVPEVQKLLAALKDSGVLTALCGAVLAAPPCPLFAPDATVVDDYTHVLSDVQLTVYMALWDLSALVAPYGTGAGDLLAEPEVLQMRRVALEQVAASAPRSRKDQVGRKTGGGFPAGLGPPHAVACWPLLQCQAVRRIYAARGLQLADVIHVLIDASVGAVNLAQDYGTRAATAAAQQLFPSRPAAAELAAQVCRALCSHADQAGAVAAAATPGRVTSRCASSSPAHSSGGDLPAQQRSQLADDAVSVEVAIRICMLGAPPEDMAACMPAVIGVRSWVQRMTARPQGSQAGAAQGFVSMSLADGMSVSDFASPRPLEVCTPRGPGLSAGGPATSLAGSPLRSPGTLGSLEVSSASQAGSAPSPPDSAPSPPNSAPSGPESTQSPTGSAIRSPPRSTVRYPSGPLASPMGPSVSLSPFQSPSMRRLMPGGLRRSFDKLRRWVSSRGGADDLRTSADLEAEIGWESGSIPSPAPRGLGPTARQPSRQGLDSSPAPLAPGAGSRKAVGSAGGSPGPYGYGRPGAAGSVREVVSVGLAAPGVRSSGGVRSGGGGWRGWGGYGAGEEAAVRRSLLRTGVLAAPLRLLRRRRPGLADGLGSQ